MPRSRLRAAARAGLCTAVLAGCGTSLSACGAHVHVSIIDHKSTGSATTPSQEFADEARQAATPAERLLDQARGTMAGLPVVQVAEDAQHFTGPPSLDTETFSPKAYASDTNEGDGAVGHLRVFDATADVRGTAAYWLAEGNAVAGAIPELSDRWVSVPQSDLGLTPAFVTTMNHRTDLAQCLVGTISGAVPHVAGHETLDGTPATVLTERAPAPSRETARLVIETAAPHRPLMATYTGPLGADPVCGTTATVGHTITRLSRRFVYGASAPDRPVASISPTRYGQLNPRDNGITNAPITALTARHFTGHWRMTGRLAATVQYQGAHDGDVQHQRWTIGSDCGTAGCRLTLATHAGRRPVALKQTSQDGYLARVTLSGLYCANSPKRRFSVPLWVSVLYADPHRVTAYTSFTVTQCGGESGEYAVWHGTD